MEFDQVVRRRKMVRRYQTGKLIPDSIITTLIENAIRAPSAGHTQVQEFIIITEPVIKSKFEPKSFRIYLLAVSRLDD